MFSSENNSKKIIKYMEVFFLIFIVLQPILDVIAYLGTPTSIIIRVLTMIIGFVYLFLYPNTKIKWLTTIYILLLGVFMVVNIANNFFLKDPFFMFNELTYNIKTIFVIEMIIVYTCVFYSVSKRIKWEEIIQRNIFISMTIIGIVMVLATITDTGKRSYDFLAKEGHSGWFFSGNEISAILGLGFGIIILYMMNKEEFRSKMFLLPSILIVMWSMLTIGTKVGLGALLAVLGIATIIATVEFIMKRKQLANVITLVVLLALSIIYIPFSAVGNNIGLNPFYLSDSGEDSSDQGQIINENEDEVTEEVEDSNELNPSLLSGRGEFLSYTITQYQVAPFSQKLLGMGIGGNYETSPKLIEMDFFDWILGYGIIGSILLYAPLFYYGFVIIRRVIHYNYKLISPTFIIVGTGVGLGFGIALFAGHVLLNPASGIYLAILISYLYVLSTKHMERSQEI